MGISAIVLSGGRSTRMGRDKATVVLGGRTLLERVIDAASGVDGIVVAGREVPLRARSGWPDVSWTLEDPPFGGPVAGIAAGLGVVDTAYVLVLACDLARPDDVVGRLAAASPGRDGMVLVDPGGWPQYLAGRYRTQSLRDRLATLGDVRDLSMRTFASGLDLTLVAADAATTADLDVPGDLPCE